MTARTIPSSFQPEERIHKTTSLATRESAIDMRNAMEGDKVKNNNDNTSQRFNAKSFKAEVATANALTDTQEYAAAKDPQSPAAGAQQVLVVPKEQAAQEAPNMPVDSSKSNDCKGRKRLPEFFFPDSLSKKMKPNPHFCFVLPKKKTPKIPVRSMESFESGPPMPNKVNPARQHAAFILPKQKAAPEKPLRSTVSFETGPMPKKLNPAAQLAAFALSKHSTSLETPGRSTESPELGPLPNKVLPDPLDGFVLSKTKKPNMPVQKGRDSTLSDPSKEALEQARRRQRMEEERAALLQEIKRKGWNYTRFPAKFKNDLEIALAAVQKDVEVFTLSLLSKELHQDEQIVLAAVRANGFALEHAPDKFRSDKKVVWEAVLQCGLALEYASPEVKACRVTVTAAIHQDPEALHYASESLRGDRRLVQKVLKQRSIDLLEEDFLRADPHFMMHAVRLDGMHLKYASTALQNNRQIVLEAVRANGAALQYATDGLRGDPMLVATSILSMKMPARKTNRSQIRAICDFLCESSTETLRRELLSILQTSQNCGDFNVFIDKLHAAGSISGMDANTFAKGVWKTIYWHKVWLLQQALPAGVGIEQQQLILEYGDAKNNFQLCDSFLNLTPLLDAFEKLDVRGDILLSELEKI